MFDIKNSKGVLILMRYEISLSRSISLNTPEQRANMDRITYVSMIGSIMYVMLYTKPNIALTLSVTSRYQADQDLEQ